MTAVFQWASLGLCLVLFGINIWWMRQLWKWRQSLERWTTVGERQVKALLRRIAEDKLEDRL